jgi:hypothetical protein|tara:strand:- start:2375 stop:3313 length:939 start_codon:yes stop_codon:yes gene_type:complete
MAMITGNSEHLIRSEVWSSQLKEVLEDELQAQQYVNWMSEFPDGTTFTIPSIGQAQVDDYVEDTAVKYRALDTGEFQFTIDQYKSSGHYITNKNKQDSFYMNQLVSAFVPKQARAILEAVETKILGLESEQTASNLNNINGAPHRFVASGTNEVFTIADFAKARYSLKKANVPDTDLIAIVDPSVEYTINTLSNLTNVSNNPRWEGIVSSGIATGMKFIKNVYGFDVYTSNYLADANETVDSVTTAAGKANMFFSASSDVLPFVGAWRQMPQVDSEYNKDFQREEYVTTARYGVKLYRPENLVCVLSDTDQV